VRQPNMMDHVTEDAQTLLQAAQEIHGERHRAQTFTPGTHLPLQEAGQRTRIRSNSIHYHDVIEELEYEGTIEWDTSARYARGDKHYVITQCGLDGLGSPGGAIQEGQEKLFKD
jgi:hypothetical protein